MVVISGSQLVSQGNILIIHSELLTYLTVLFTKPVASQLNVLTAYSVSYVADYSLVNLISLLLSSVISYLISRLNTVRDGILDIQ